MNIEREWSEQRETMVDRDLRNRGIRDVGVLTAMSMIPRHRFVPPECQDGAYSDAPLPIGGEQTISQPYTVAFQTALLELQPHFKVMEVGTGSGYQAAILSALGARVFTIERIRKLYQTAHIILSKLNYPVRFHYGDGYAGLPQFAPFDRILITAAIPEVPQILLGQLAIGGILVAPVGGRTGQTMIRVLRIAEEEFQTTSHGAFTFVPMLKGKE